MRLIAFIALLATIAAAQETPLDPLVETTAAARSGSTMRLQERASLLRDLIRSTPAAARRFLLSDRDADRLRALDPNAPIEAWETAESTNVYIADDFDGRRATYIYEAGGMTGYQESVHAPSVTCGDTVRLQGYRIGDTMLVADATVVRHAAETPACNTVGPQKLAIIYARMPGLGAPLATMDQLKSWIFSGDLSAPRFWDISSFGALQLSGDVIGPVDLDRQYGCNDTEAIQNAAYAAAAKLADLTQYNRIFIALPIVGSCSWGGFDSVGCITISLPGGGRHVTSMGAMNTPASLAGVQRYIFHEVGHGLGLTHSNAYIAPADTLPPDRSRSTVLEYGDQYSAMGSGPASTYALPQKEIFGWLKESETVRTVRTDADAELVPMGVEGVGLRGLKVRRKSEAGDEFVWVEYRTQAGTDVNLPALQPGAILHYTPTQTRLSAELLDASPGVPGDQQSYLDPVLVVGRKWQDPYSDLSIEAISATPDRLKVSIRYAQQCATVTWPASKAIPPSGGPFSPQVAVNGDCRVVARSNNYWIQPASAGAADFLAQPNKSTLSRTATVTVDRQTIAVRQDGPKADLKLDSMAPLTGTLRAGAFDLFELNVSAPNGSSSIGELRILLGAAAKADGACLLTYSGGLMHLANNAGTADAGVLHPGVSEQTSNSQCTIATLGVTNVTPTLVRLTFYILPNGTTYLGDKKLYVALRHAQDAAIGSYTEAGSFTVAAGCQAFLAPPRVSVAGTGGAATFTVNVPANCTWDVAAPDAWTRVTVNRNANPPSVTVAVAANPLRDGRRSGIAVLGTAFVVEQLGAGVPVNPSVAFDGAEVLISRRGGAGQAYFTTNLPPSAVYPASDQPWLRVDYRSNLNASIGQSVLYYTEPNLSPVERVATILVGPALLAVIQEAGPTDPGANAIQTLAGAGLIQTGSALDVHVARPGQIAYGRNGDLYITEPDYFRVLNKVALDGTVATVAGIGAPGEPLYGAPASQSRLLAVRGVAADSRGNVFISMASDVVRVSPDGILTRVVSDMSSAQGLAVDNKDNLYIADSGVHRIFVLHPDGKYEPFAGTGAAGFSGDGGNPLNARLRAPASVAAGVDGSVYIADAGNFAIRRVLGANMETIIGTGANGAATDGRPAKGQSINAPGQIAVDSAGTVYWTVPGSRVRSIDPAGIVGSLAGGGPFTPAEGIAAVSAGIDVQGVAVDPTSPSQLAAVSDRINNAIRQVDDNRALRKLAGRDTTEFVGDGGPVGLALLYWPLFGAYGPDGLLYFSDSRNNRIRRIDADGTIETIAGTGRYGFAGDRGPATAAILYEPSGVAFDGDGNLYFSDTSNFRIRKIDHDGVITTVAGTGVPGFSGDNGVATAAAIRTPRGIAFSPSGTLYFADSANHRIRSISPDGQIGTVVGNGTAAFNGDGGPAELAALNSPQDVAFDASGTIYIADSGNGRIRTVDAGGTITTIAGNGLSGGASDLARSTSLGTLAGLAVAPNGDIYASDARAHQVVRITPDGLLQVVAGTAVAGFGGDGGPGWAAMTFSPAGLVLDPAGNLVVFDSRNDRIRAINAK